MLPADGHVHSQWSWDAERGDMEATCARAVEVGLPALAFTEHVDWTPWNLHGSPVAWGKAAREVDGVLVVDPLDVDGYLDSVERCRARFPGLRIRTGVELSEPHLHPERTAALLAGDRLEQVLGSVHALPDRETGAGWVEAGSSYTQREPLTVVRDYLAGALALASSDAPFAVLAHLDYPLRQRQWWGDGPFDWRRVEGEARAVLEALAASGRALEVNTRMPVPTTVLAWWREAGGDAVSFGSDAHEPGRLAADFADAADLVAACGFRPGADPTGLWGRG